MLTACPGASGTTRVQREHSGAGDIKRELRAGDVADDDVEQAAAELAGEAGAVGVQRRGDQARQRDEGVSRGRAGVVVPLQPVADFAQPPQRIEVPPVSQTVSIRLSSF